MFVTLRAQLLLFATSFQVLSFPIGANVSVSFLSVRTFQEMSSRNQLDKSTAIAQDAHWRTSRRANLLGRPHRAGTNWTSQLQSLRMLTGTLPVEQTCSGDSIEQ